MRAALAAASAAVLALLGVAAPAATGAQAASPLAHGRLVASGSPAPCTGSAVSGQLDLGSVGGSSTSPAGAMVFHDVADVACTLEGAPTVAVESAAGTPVALYELRSVPRHDRAVVLTPGRSGRTAAASVTWSFWGCPPGSYSLEVHFAGWSATATLGSPATSGYSGPACTSTDQTIYVGAVAAGHG